MLLVKPIFERVVGKRGLVPHCRAVAITTMLLLGFLGRKAPVSLGEIWNVQIGYSGSIKYGQIREDSNRNFLPHEVSFKSY